MQKALEGVGRSSFAISVNNGDCAAWLVSPYAVRDEHPPSPGG